MVDITKEEDRKKALLDKQEHAKRQITNIFLQLGHLPFSFSVVLEMHWPKIHGYLH